MIDRIKLRHWVALLVAALVMIFVTRWLPNGQNSDEASANIEQGTELYLANCASCHGLYGEGDGPASMHLETELRDLRYIAQRNNGEFPRQLLIEIIDGRESRAKHGPADMPIWGDAFTAFSSDVDDVQGEVSEKIAVLVEFLASIQQSQKP